MAEIFANVKSGIVPSIGVRILYCTIETAVIENSDAEMFITEAHS
jgi:hypothetical protein